MEQSADKVPELPVETENIRRSSSSISDIKCIDSSSETSVRKTSLISSKTLTELNEDVKSEIRRVDSDSQFGVMETISLDISVQEANLAAESTTEICENPLMLKRPPDLDNKDEFEIRETSTPPVTTEPDKNNDPTALSKYFGQHPVSATGDPDSIQFFDALSGMSSNSCNSGVATNDLPKTAGHPGNTTKVPSGLEKVTVETQPPLLKFFSDDKSGNDADGKAFFDKIASVDSQGLELTQPILSESPESITLLISPSLNGEIEEAWIPSEKTRQILVSVVTSGNYTVERKDLTFPEIIIDDKMDDPVKALLLECNSPEAQQRKNLTANDVPENESGLQKLIEAECYHAAINLTTKIIKSFDQAPAEENNKSSNQTPLSLRIWYTRLAILIKLRKFSLAEVESAAFGDFEKPDLYYEFYPDLYKGKRGTMVPFSFRLLLAELPQYQGNHQVALDNMYKILHVIQKIIKNVESGCAEDGSMIELSESRKRVSLEIWRNREQRVLYSILNCVLSQKDYILAVSVANIVLKKSPENAPQLLSALGRIYLQLGDVKCAQDCFTKAATIANERSQQHQVEENINKACLAIAHNNCEEAYKYYEQAYNMNPTNPMLVNNMAVCLLYLGRLKESLALLETTIQKNPTSCLHDGIIFNICTLYELESSRCSQKKIAMLELISKYVGDSFNVSCLKIQPVK